VTIAYNGSILCVCQFDDQLALELAGAIQATSDSRVGFSGTMGNWAGMLFQRSFAGFLAAEGALKYKKSLRHPWKPGPIRGKIVRGVASYFLDALAHWELSRVPIFKYCASAVLQ
jgi:hypothetical protein